MKKVVFLGLVAWLSASAFTNAETVTDLSKWTVTGSVTMDASKPDTDGKPSIKLAPGSQAVLNLRPEEGSGKVTLSVYDDGTIAAPDQKKAPGPRWGLVGKDGRILVGGIMYAKFLPNTGAVATFDTDPKAQDAWGSPKYAAAREKAPGWTKWTFDYNPDSGLLISVNDKPLDSRHFDWKSTKATGFTGIVLFGDGTGEPTAQTAWVGGISYELGPPMKVTPESAPVLGADSKPYPNISAPPPPPDTPGASVPATPAAAPLPYTPGPTLSDDMKNLNIVPTPGYLAHHPRLLFSSSDKAALQQKAKDEPELWNAVLESAGFLKTVPPAAQISVGQKYYRIRDVESGALAWYITGDATYATDAINWMVAHAKVPVWGVGFRDNIDLQASWYLYYLSISYDILYSQMSDADRKTVRDGLAAHAKAIYDSFDPANFNKGRVPYDQNHTYNPAVALTAAALVLYGNVPEAADWLNRAHAMMARSRYVLNEDGYYYESWGYWQYALHWHERYADLMTRATGERMHDLPALRDNWMYGLYLSLPSGGFEVGDTGGVWKDGALGKPDVTNTEFLWGQARAAQSPESRLVADMFGQRHLDKDDPASAFLWSAPPVKAADINTIKPYHYFSDVDVVSWRSGWGPDATAYLFRCGPPLGHSAMAKLDQMKDWEMNTGHVHSDIGSFYMYGKGEQLAVITGYTAQKWTRDQNTILIDGKGQGLDGDYHAERALPYKNFDAAKIDHVFLGDQYGYASGEYGATYAREVKDVTLRRSLLMTKDWMLAIDDLASPQPHAMTWICHSVGAFTPEGPAFVSRQPDAGLAVVPLLSEGFTPAEEPTTVFAGMKPGAGKAEQHGFQLTLTQSAPATASRLITLLVPLGKDEKIPEAKLVKQDASSVEFTVTPVGGKPQTVKLDLTWKTDPASPAKGPAVITGS